MGVAVATELGCFLRRFSREKGADADNDAGEGLRARQRRQEIPSYREHFGPESISWFWAVP